MEKPSRSKRKSELFSVSFRSEDLKEVRKFLDNMRDETGMAPTRNELIRRSVLAHIRFMRQNEVDYKKTFKSIR